MKKLNSYMNPFQKWKARWKLRRIIVALEHQTDFNEHVTSFVKSALKAPPEAVIKREQERTNGSQAGVIKTVNNLDMEILK